MIPTLGTRIQWLRETLRSITLQSEVEIEVVIVTPSPGLVDEVANAFDVPILHSTSPGISAAVNEGWDKVQSCPYISWLGDDDLLAPGSLAASLSMLEFDARLSATYGRVRYIDGHGNSLFTTHPGAFAAHYLPWGKDLVPQPGSLFRRTAVESAGGLDTSLRYAMDYDLFLKLKRCGRLAYLPKEVAAFRLHEGSITGSNVTDDEAKRLRAAAHSSGVNKMRRVLQGVAYCSDRLLYKAIQRRQDPVPILGGYPYTKVADGIHQDERSGDCERTMGADNN